MSNENKWPHTIESNDDRMKILNEREIYQNFRYTLGKSARELVGAGGTPTGGLEEPESGQPAA